ncbi:MAG: glycosyltransferase family 39 protein [Acidobacteria bacterium]|nr:glycosyltransferase family 39 protein [Acidobacteriota bacterium]
MTPADTASQQQWKMNDRVWLASGAAIVLVSAFLRFYDLGLKPFHHDEGVNGFFLKNLFNDGVYKYDPANYHGPTLYYVSLFFAKVFGLQTIPVRMSVAVFGVLTVALALFLRRYLGDVGSLFAALFLALSPGMVFISRYFIHEMIFVFLSLAFVVAVLFFIEKQRVGPFAIGWMVLLLVVGFLPSAMTLAAFLGGDSGILLWSLRTLFFLVEAGLIYTVTRMLAAWDSGRPIYLILAAASVALLFATKETGFITLGTMAISCLAVWIWRGIRNGRAFDRNGSRIIFAVHAAALLAALYYRYELAAAWRWLNDNFFNPARAPENFVFYSIILLIIVSAAAWISLLLDLQRTNDSGIEEPVELTWPAFTAGLGRNADAILIAAACTTTFIYLIILFFTSYFTYAEGVSKAIEAYTIWTKTGSKDHTQNGYLAYLKWGMKVESPVYILSTLGVLIALVRGKHRFAIFTAAWAVGLFVAYTIIPYKTPWLDLSFILPMCLIAGYGLNELITSRATTLKVAGGFLAVLAAFVLTYQTYQLSFVRYDDEEMAYVYAHTKRGFLDLVKQIDHYAAKSDKGKSSTINIVSPDYWPLTWYLNDYDQALFHGQLVDSSTAEMILAKKPDQDQEVIKRYSAHYVFVGVYPLRPGVDLVLLVRRDLADPGAQELYKLPEAKVSP